MSKRGWPHVDDPVSVGQRLKDARLAAGMSQRELSFPGCTAVYICRIERGDRVPSLQVLRELAKRLKVSEQYLAHGRSISPGERFLMEFPDTPLEILQVLLGVRNWLARPVSNDPANEVSQLKLTVLFQLQWRTGPQLKELSELMETQTEDLRERREALRANMQLMLEAALAEGSITEAEAEEMISSYTVELEPEASTEEP